MFPTKRSMTAAFLFALLSIQVHGIVVIDDPKKHISTANPKQQEQAASAPHFLKARAGDPATKTPIAIIHWFAGANCMPTAAQKELYYNVPPLPEAFQPYPNQCESGMPPYSDPTKGNATAVLPFAPASFIVSNTTYSCSKDVPSALSVVRLYADCPRKDSGIAAYKFYCPDTCPLEVWTGGDKYGTCVNSPNFAKHGQNPEYSVLYDIDVCEPD